MVKDEEIVINLTGDGRDYGTVTIQASQVDCVWPVEEIARVYVAAGFPVKAAKDLARKVIRRVKARFERRIGAGESGEARPPFAEKVSVVAWGSDLPPGAIVDIPRNIQAIDLYLVREKRWVTDFCFDAGSPGSLKSGLSRYGGIDDIFIIAHGIWEPTFVISTLPRPTSGDIPGHFGESYVLSGIAAEEVIKICKTYVRGTIHICACNF
jgi:hypothetical protein